MQPKGCTKAKGQPTMSRSKGLWYMHREVVVMRMTMMMMVMM